MEIATLTAVLQAQIAGFERDMASADAIIAGLRKSLGDLEKKALEATAGLQKVKISTAQAAETRAAEELIAAGLDKIRDKAIQAELALAAVDMRRISATRLYDEQARMFGIPNRAGGAIPLTSGSYVSGPSFAQAEADYQRLRNQMLADQRASNGALIMGGSRATPFGFGRNDLGPYIGRPSMSGEEAAIDYLARHGIDRNGNFIGGGGGGGGFFGRYGRGGDDGRRYTGYAGRGFFGGLLPGGVQASAAAVTTALGLALASGPAAGTATAGLALGGTAVIGSLIGGLSTLALAFHGISSEAFKTEKAFAQLTPEQQKFVTTLRELDAGIGKQLKDVAQSNVLPGITAALHAAFTPASTKALTSGVGAFGGALSGGLQQLGGLFGSQQFAGSFGAVLQADAGYLRDMFNELTHVIDGFTHLQQAAIPLTDWLSKNTVELTKWFDASIKAAQASGSLAKWMDNVKLSMQALGNLFTQVGRAFGAIFQAVGLRNSIALVNLVARAFKELADFIFANKMVLRDFFEGALGAANDMISAISGILKVLTPLLHALDTVVKAIGGWRTLIDVLAVAWVADMLAMQVATIGLAAVMEALPWVALATAAIVAITFIITHWKQITHAIPILFHAAVLAVKGDLYLMVYLFLERFNLILRGMKRAFGWVPIVGGELSKVSDRFNEWVTGFKDKAASSFREAGSMAASAFHDEVMSGMQKTAQDVAAYLASNPANNTMKDAAPGAMAALQRSLDAQQKASTTKISVILPKAIQNAIYAAQAGHGDLDKANARAYAYYEKLLQTPGLTQAQKNAIYQAEAQYTNTGSGSSNPYGTPGALTPDPATHVPFSGTGVLPAGMRSRLSAAQTRVAGYTYSATGPFDSKALRAAIGLSTQLSNAYDYLTQKLHDQSLNAKQLNAVEKERLAVAKELERTQKKVSEELMAQQRMITSNKIDKILGLGGDGSSSGQSLLTRERQVLLAALARAGHVSGHGHFASTTSNLIPGAANLPLDQLIKQMQAIGIDIPKSTLTSLHKINEAIELARKDHQKLSSEQTQNIAARLTQINDTLKALIYGHSNYRVPSEEKLTAGLGLTGAQRSAVGARLAQALSHGGKVPTGPAALGIPLGSGGQVVVQNFSGPIHISVEANGSDADGKVIAAKVRDELLKGARRNPTQTRGPNAGRNRGLN